MSPPPTIITNGVLTAFTKCSGVASTAQTFTVSGANLTTPLVVAAYTGLEYSLDGTTYSSTLSLTPTSGTVATTTIYVRMTAASTSLTSGNISLTSTSATTQTVAVSGSVTALPVITTQPTTPLSLCQNSSYTLAANVTGASAYQWYYNTTNSNTGGTSLGSANFAQTGGLSIVTSSPGTVYYYFVASTGSCSTTSAVSTVTVSPTPVAGTASATATSFCSGNSTTLSLTGSTGNIQWQQSSTVNGTYTNISGATLASYTTPVLTATTYYKAVVSSGVCTPVNSNIITITVTSIPVPTLASTPSVQIFTTVGSTNWTAPVGVNQVEYLVVGGGGGGGNGWDSAGGGGGGGGMVLTGKLSVTPGTTYPIVIGDGGDGGISVRYASNGSIGSTSQLATIKAFGGGKGYGARASITNTSIAQNSNCEAAFGGSGGPGGAAGKGGGGASGNGTSYSGTTAGTGGAGFTSSITGSSTVFGVGGAGGSTSTLTGTIGTSNRGNGGKGGGASSASSAAGGKGGSGIVVVKYALETNAISYCQGATAIPLSATASNGYTLQWYTVPTGGVASGTAPTPDTSITGTTTYYVSQKDNTSGCESDRIAIVVTVNSNPAAPSVSNSVINYCQGDVATPLAATNLTGNTLQWYNGSTPLTYCGPIPSTATAGATTYNVTQFVNLTGCESTSTSLTVNVYPAPVGGTATAPSSVCLGATASITLANSTGNIQWQQLVGSTWTDIAGETSTTLVTQAITQTTSFRAKLSGQYCLDVFSNIVNVSITTAPLAPGYGLDFDGSNDYISVPNSTTYNYITGNAFTLEAWVKINAAASSINTILGRKSPGGGTQGYAFYVNSWGSSDRKLVFEATTGTFLSTGTIPNDTWTHVAVSVTSSGAATMYINGVADGTGNVTIPTSSQTLNVGAFGNNGYFYFNGGLDEVRIWNVAKTASEINTYKSSDVKGFANLQLYYKLNEGTGSTANDSSSNANNGTLSNFALTGSRSNWVSSSFQDVATISGNSNLCTGATTTLSHTATGGTWTSASTNVATVSSTGVVTGVTAGTSVISYTYTYNGCSFTDTITITINATQAITSQPSTVAQNNCINGTATALSITASGTGLTYQWYKNTSAINTGGTIISGATSASYTPLTTTAGTNYYYCVVGSSCGTTVSSNVSGAIVVSPASIAGTISGTNAICTGATTTLTLAGSVGTIQWQRYDSPIWTDLTGATNATLTTPTLTQNTTYRATVTSGYCSGASTANYAITVNSIPVITVHPSTASQTLCLNTTATALTVTATGTGLTYQWYKNTTVSTTGGTAITGATSASYTPLTTIAGTLYYYCVVGGTCTPAVTSNVSGAIVVSPASIAGTISGTNAICTGATSTLTLSGSVGTIQWQRYDSSVWTDLTGATNATLITPTLTQNTTYRATVTSGYCSGASTANYAITVNPIPVISGATTVGAGNTVTLTSTTTASTINPWVSSNPAVATVSNTGVVSGLTTGSTTITFTNNNGCTTTTSITVNVGTTLTPVLTSPVSNATGSTTLNFNYTLSEGPLAGSVKLIFTPTAGGSPIIWTMTNTTSAVFSYTVGTNPTLISNVVSGTALGFTTYNVTLVYQDGFGNPAATTTNTNIQTLAPPSISFAQSSYTGLVNVAMTTIVSTNTGGVISSYSISPALPNGLVFNTTTGSISGTPTATQAAINYTITATNAAGSDAKIISLFIDADSDGDGVPNSVEIQQGTNPNSATSFRDTDGDGVPDYIEVQQGTNPNVPGAKDTDGDGVPDYIEVQQGTNPNVPGAKDTDGDGVPDYIEVQQGTSPTTPGARDTDGDGVPDYVEVQQGTNPSVPGAKDTDGDGVPDYIEVQQGTNPNVPGAKDTDGDGVPDYIEVQQGTNPNVPGAKDTDGDGVPDYIELQQGTNPNVPGAKDTDGDGVPDYIEVQQGTSPTTPGAKDTDGDGVPDYVEAQQGTNPNVPGAKDTDGDGVPDYIELQQGTNPNVPGDRLIDTDRDGIPDYIEIRLGTNPNVADATDSDNDGISNYKEGYNYTNPSASLDTDRDGIPDYLDVDSDGDSILDRNDAFPFNRLEWADTDRDGIGNNADTDDDNDGILDACDVDSNGDGIPDNGTDMDADGIIDSCDSDKDGDGVNNTSDNCPNSANTNQADRDSDGAGDVCDAIELDVTQALTPNGDGINDTWVIYNLGNHPASTVRVFNANGMQVFYSANYQNNWTGNYQGSSEMLPVGSYMYQIDLGGDGTIDSQGWLYITK
jgi:gliding motility-associated-like protein